MNTIRRCIHTRSIPFADPTHTATTIRLVGKQYVEGGVAIKATLVVGSFDEKAVPNIALDLIVGIMNVVITSKIMIGPNRDPLG